MTQLFAGPLWVHYRQAYVVDEQSDGFPMPDEAASGQVNGLCGAAVPGSLFLTTGLHTGPVGFVVDLVGQPPPLEDWEDVVEVSYRPRGEQVALIQWAGEAGFPLKLPRQSYRVRYCATGMDEAHRADSVPTGGSTIDSYALIFWPAEPGPDLIVRQTSELAAYWHTAWTGTK